MVRSVSYLIKKLNLKLRFCNYNHLAHVITSMVEWHFQAEIIGRKSVQR